MKIDTDKFMTVEQAGALFGANKRAAYRALKRARKAGREITVVIFGRSLVPASAVETLKKFYYPYYSEAHQANVKKWGSAGGRQKKINSAALAASSRRGTSRKEVEGQKSE